MWLGEWAMHGGGEWENAREVGVVRPLLDSSKAIGRAGV